MIATDSAEILDVARAAGAECILTSSAHPSGTDRVAEVAARPEFSAFDVVLNVQGDEPFVPTDALTGALGVVRERGFALGTAAARADAGALRDPNVVKVVAADDGRALYFSRAPVPFLRDARDAAEQGRIARRHIGVYAYERGALARWVALPTHALERVERLEQLRPLAAGLAMGVALIEGPAPRGIDTEEDLEWANEHWGVFTTGRG